MPVSAKLDAGSGTGAVAREVSSAVGALVTVTAPVVPAKPSRFP
jgi:ubiquinone/menaquinone biosynthesis C-methylase UbiE